MKRLMARKEDFNHAVPLPPGLTVVAIRKAVDYMERQLADLVDIYHEQANVFSGIVGIFGTKALDSVSTYEKHRNIDTAQQRFPDLKRRGSGIKPKPNECLESKASKRAWTIQSHYDHSGWYIIWRYLVDPTESIEPGKPVIIWRVDESFWFSPIGNTKRVAPVKREAVARTRSPSRTRPGFSRIEPFINGATFV